MVALCICLRNFTDTVQWKIQEYYAPDKAFKLVFSCHSSVSYLFPLLNVQRMDATEKRLIFGWTLWPASCMVKPWLTTWLTTVARISSEIMALLLALSLHPLPPPPPPLTLTPLPFWSPLTSMLPSIVLQTRSSPVALILLKLWFQIAQQPWKWKFCQLNSSVFCLNTRRFWHWWSVQSREDGV